MDEGAGRLERFISPVGPVVAGRRRTLRDWIVDVLVVLVALVISAVAAQATVDAGTADDLMFLDTSLGVVALLSLFWRRRWPVQLLLLVSVFSVVSSASAGPALALLFTVAVHRPAGRALLLGAISLLPLPLFWLTHPPKDLWVDVTFGVAFSAIAVAWGMFVRARRQLVLSLAERARAAEADQHARAERARNDERARIAREMHDVLGHRLSLLSLHAGALEYRPDADPDEVARAAGVIRAAAHDALTELRGAIGALRGTDGAAPEPPQPAIGDLDRLLEECRAAGVRVDATVDAPLQRVPATLGRSAYRVVQEGLTNARKHAPGARVDVALRGAPGGALVVEVANPVRVGAAVGPALPGAGTGLVGLRERADLAGGELESGEEGDGTWRLRATLPWPA